MTQRQQEEETPAHTMIPTYIQVRSMAHLKELASSGANGSDDQDFFTYYGHLHFAHRIGYAPKSMVPWCVDEDAYTDTNFEEQTLIPDYIQRGVLYAESETGGEELRAAAIDVVYEGVSAVFERAGVISWESSHWTEVLIPPAIVQELWITKDATRIFTFVSGDRLHFAEPKYTNFPADLPFYDWVKLVRREEEEGNHA